MIGTDDPAVPETLAARAGALFAAFQAALAAFPNPQAFVTCSHEIDPTMMEYERTSTTVVNAYLGAP